MTTPSICITSVGCRERYVPYLDRLEESLRRWAPNIPRLFFRDVWPPHSPTHHENHYAFKAHAISALYWAGFDIAIWLDAACEVVGNLAPLLEIVKERGYYIVAGTEPLGEWISDQALDFFHTSRDEAMKVGLCGGAIVAIDFRKKDVLGYGFLFQWLMLASKGLFYTSHSAEAPDKMRSLRVSDGPNGEVHSTDQRCKGHRSDEACFSLMLKQRGLKPQNVSDLFTTRENPNPKGLIKTGYDIEREEYSDTKTCEACGRKTHGRYVCNGTYHPSCGTCIERMETRT